MSAKMNNTNDTKSSNLEDLLRFKEDFMKNPEIANLSIDYPLVIETNKNWQITKINFHDNPNTKENNTNIAKVEQRIDELKKQNGSQNESFSVDYIRVLKKKSNNLGKD